MRMNADDWAPVAMPWQLWLSSALLLAGSVQLQRAAGAARAGRAVQARALLLAGGALAMAFLGVQLWAWSALLDARIGLAGNPAASFFYLLTALHGLHVLGGLVGWSVAMGAAWAAPAAALPAAVAATAAAVTASRIALCARYWHFLFAVWVGLFAALGWLSPEFVRAICGTR
jgi:cytochrome c oxidase subunit 3